MASFTDSPQTFFSPAMPMVDLNLYGQTLDYKQSQYNQGVQRIQGSIDQVAGLDIMHPLAKDYLHNKLTELGSKVNTLAGGDFSNQSLVNQAMSLAPQVAKDEKIQTALISTQQIRALSASQKRLYEKNPELYPTSMRYMDNKAVGDYLNGTDLNEGYHGVTEASRYTDYHKQVEDLVKQIVPDVKLEVNADGRYQWKTEKYSTVTNDRIQNVIGGYFASNPEATRSLNADALFTYKDASPKFLAQHLDETYSKNIHALKSINEQYRQEILNHPTSRDFIEDRRAAMAANEKSIQEMYSKRNLYPHYLNNPDMVDQVKQTVFADNLKGMFSTIFQKDDIDRKIEENYNAKNADDFAIRRGELGVHQAEFGLHQIKTKEELIASGSEPFLDKNGNPIPLTPDSKYWTQYQASLKSKKGKKGDGTDGGENEAPFGGQPEVGGKTPEVKYANTELLEGQKKILTDAIHNDAGTGIQDLFFNKWYQKNKELIPDQAAAHTAFDNMIKAQKTAFQEGQPTTAEFREYWQKASMYQLKLDALDKLKDKALDASLQQNPSKLAPFSIPNVTIPGVGKRIVTIDPKNDTDFMKLLSEYTAAVASSKGSYSYSGGGMAGGYSSYTGPTDKDILAKFKDRPNYQILEALVKDPVAYNQLSSKLIMPQAELQNSRDNVVNEYLKQNEKDYAPQEYTITEKPGSEEYKTAQRRVLSLLTNNQGVGKLDKYDMKKHDEDDVQVLAASTDPTGKVTYKFKLKGQNVDYVTSTQPNADGILPVDPDADLKQVIHITGITPTKGDGVLATKNGKVRFAIGESTYDKNQYDAYVIVQGVPVEIRTTLPNGYIFHGASPSQITKSLEAISMQPSRSNPNVPMSREEAIDKLTMEPHVYEAKYPKPVATTK